MHQDILRHIEVLAMLPRKGSPDRHYIGKADRFMLVTVDLLVDIIAQKQIHQLAIRRDLTQDIEHL